MDLHTDFDVIEPELDDIGDQAFPIGVTLAGGMHESDLLSFVERARRMAGEVC